MVGIENYERPDGQIYNTILEFSWDLLRGHDPRPVTAGGYNTVFRLRKIQKGARKKVQNTTQNVNYSETTSNNTYRYPQINFKN